MSEIVKRFKDYIIPAVVVGGLLIAPTGDPVSAQAPDKCPITTKDNGLKERALALDVLTAFRKFVKPDYWQTFETQGSPFVDEQGSLMRKVSIPDPNGISEFVILTVLNNYDSNGQLVASHVNIPTKDLPGMNDKFGNNGEVIVDPGTFISHTQTALLEFFELPQDTLMGEQTLPGSILPDVFAKAEFDGMPVSVDANTENTEFTVSYDR